MTKRQKQILEFFRSYSDEHGIAPTLEEAAQHFGLNKVTVFGHVAELERKGVLARAKRGISRGLRIVDADPAPQESAGVSVLGRIAAGAPIEALEEPEVFDWNALTPEGAGIYALRVAGDSMIDDGIHDGDLVLIEPRKQAESGETVVAILPGEVATLKRYYPIPGGARLVPANASLQPVEVKDLEIRGVLVGVVRQI